MKSHLALRVALVAVCTFLFLAPAAVLAAPSCGDGNLDPNEECDGGGPLYIDGDPANDTCSNGSRCYFQFTCCKFNCQYVGTPGSPCQDGDNCTGPDTCNQVGQCLGGPNAADDTPCDDGLYCTGVESCQNGHCASTTGDPCPGTACNQCQEDTDSCLNPAGSQCSNGDTCVTGGTCDGLGTCQGGVFNNNPCDDGLYCNGSDACDGGACHLHSGDPCTQIGDPDGDCSESCDEGSNTCSAVDIDDSPCDDSLFCNGAGDTCLAGVCSGTGVAGCDDLNSCTSDACNEGTDSCMHTTIGDGIACDDGDPCSLDDLCSGGLCVGAPPLLEDFCPWTLVLREQERKDLFRAYFAVNVEGDVCSGSVKLYGQVNITSDLVADEAEGEDQLQLSVDDTIGEDIVSAGGGATANPSISFLPYLTPEVVTLVPLSVVAKDDGTGFFDFSGTHPLVNKCHAVRNSYADATAELDALTSSGTAGPVRLGPLESMTIPPFVVGGVNVIDIEKSIKVGDGATLELDGGGDPDTVVVLRIGGRMKLYVLSSLTLTGGLTPDHVLIYVKGKKCLINTFSIGAGTLLCSPGRVVARQGVAWIGAIFGDGKYLSAGQSATFIYQPFQAF